jgi:hypothetical protein
MRSLVKIACLATTVLVASAQSINLTVTGVKSANITTTPHTLSAQVSALVNTTGFTQASQQFQVAIGFLGSNSALVNGTDVVDCRIVYNGTVASN